MSARHPGRLIAAVASAFVASAVAASSALAQEVGFRASLSADTVYVGQQASYQLTVTIPADVRQRLRRNPEFVPPEARSMLVYDLPVPRARPGGEGPEVHTFRRAIFALTPGRYSIAPARLTFSIPQSPSFFSREEERTLRSEGVTLVAIEPPTAGRPAAWTGAVGRWRASVRADAANARVGDPFVLTLRVEGTGNATLLPRPSIDISWANVVAEDERVVLDSTPTTLGGAKEFAWLVTPREPGSRTVPSLPYVFFDPVSRSYEVARTSPLSVRVAAGDLVTFPSRATAARAQQALAIEPQLSGARRVVPPWPWAWALFTLLAPLPWVAARMRERRPRAKRVRPPEHRLRDAAVTRPEEVRSLFGAALLRRTGLSLSSWTGGGSLATALRREGVTAETAAETEHLRDQLDTGAYAGETAVPELRDRARKLLARIDEEARRRRGGAALLLLVVLAACAPVHPPDRAALDAFSQGRTAYTGEDYARARDAFLRAANATPRDPSAWANLGTAGWQAHDTATAVLGWQRALRLEPTNEALRARLELVRAPQSRGAARVWALPPLPIAAAALVLWLAGWGLAAARRWKHRSARLSALLIVPSLLLAALAFAAEWQSRARDLAVIATATPLRSLPALGAEPGSVPLVGEVVRVRERRGVWLHIELEAGRSGWYPTERTHSLARE